MAADQSTPSELLQVVAELKDRIRILEQEKLDTELLLETVTTHADAIEVELQAEIAERERAEAALRMSANELQSLLAIVSRDMADLEMMLETSLSHGDTIADILCTDEAKYRAIFENAVEGIGQFGLDGSFLGVNRSLARIYGHVTPDEVLTQIRTIQRLPTPDPDRRVELWTRLTQDQAIVNFESQIYQYTGDSIWISETAYTISTDHDQSYVIIVSDITQRKRAEEALNVSQRQLEEQNRALQDMNESLQSEVQERQRVEHALQQANKDLERLVNVDGLTQVSNRRYFNEVFQRGWCDALQNQHPLTLILADIDDFKAYNDAYGHLAGDDCLYQVAQVLNTHAHGGLVARYGGEEFAMILTNTDPVAAYTIAQDVRQGLADLQIPHQRSRVKPYVSLSLGVATLIPQLDDRPDKLITLSDQALYRAKANGRDQVVQHRIPHELLR